MPVAEVIVAAKFAGTGYNCLQDMCNCLIPHCEYVTKLDENFKQLLKDSKELAALKGDVNEEIRSKGMERTRQCRNWFDETKETEEKIGMLEEKYKNISNSRCVWDMCPFLKLRKLGKDIVETTKDIVKRKEKMKELKESKDVTWEKAPVETTPSQHDIFELKSRNEDLEKLLKLLKDESLSRIGIWGAEGIGKTTLLTMLHKELERRKDTFGNVFFVSVPRVLDSVRKIQEDLLSQLNPRANVNNESTTQVLAARISASLVKMRKYVVLLDQLSSKINLTEVGINSTAGSCHKYGKIVFATTQKSIYTEDMGVNEFFNVKSLPLDDRLTLFEKTVVRNHSPIQAKKIVRELGGNPRLIKAVATTLRTTEYNEFDWESHIRKLQSPTQSPTPHFPEVYNAFEFVYGKLQDAHRKRCLLFAALFPKGFEIYDDYLVETWRIERFIPDERLGRIGENGQPLRAARLEGHDILKNLTELCLLERCPRVKYVKMPESFIGPALKTAYPKEDCHLLVKAGEPLGQHPTEDTWMPAKRISLICCELSSLPDSPRCSKLTTLLIQNNMDLSSIPGPFFAQMPRLHILDLHQTGIESLPPSLFNLISLKGLFLNKCKRLVVLSSKIAKLKNLEVLDIRNTSIHSLPVQFGQLSNLQCLRVSFHNYSGILNSLNKAKFNILQFWKKERPNVMIPPKVIMKLHRLEELTIDVDPCIQVWNTMADEISKEVRSLKFLTTLCFYFPSVESLKMFIASSISSSNTTSTSWSGLKSYKLLVGNHESQQHFGLNVSPSSSERFLRYSAGEGIIIPTEIKQILKEETKSFELIAHRNVQSLSDFGTENMESLQVCVIKECNEMGSIVCCNSSVVGRAIFPALEKLQIVDLQSLNCIWSGQAVPESLRNLKDLTLNGCPMLTRILSQGITQLLQQLVCLRVENCGTIGDIIEAHESPIPEIVEADDLSSALPKLENLELIKLPNLESICRSDALNWPRLTKIEIKECPRLSFLSLNTTNATELKEFLCEKVWWEALQVQPDSLRQRIQSICHYVEEPSSVYRTQTEVSPVHEALHVQQHDPLIVANHTMENSTDDNASSSMIADVERPNDPSSSRWASFCCGQVAVKSG